MEPSKVGVLIGRKLQDPEQCLGSLSGVRRGSQSRSRVNSVHMGWGHLYRIGPGDSEA